MKLCPLCHNNSISFYKNSKFHSNYHRCNNCDGIFIDKKNRLSKCDEKRRYNEHNNDVEDKKYQKFVSPITYGIIKNFTKQDSGLDFGAGTGPVISKILQDKKFNIDKYDPFFHNNPVLLKKQYDYIACCEVIEHFYNPQREFKLLKKLLRPNGRLYCMTDIYNDDIDFNNWYYKNDPTHVFIYTKKTLEWIKDEFNFTDLKINKRLVIYNVSASVSVKSCNY